MRVKRIIVRALEDLGVYLTACLKDAVIDLDLEIIKIPDSIYRTTLKFPGKRDRMENLGALEESYQKEVDFINQYSSKDTIVLYFTDWSLGWPETRFTDYYDRFEHKKVFWNREDPTHTDLYLKDARAADVICTSARECITRYENLFPKKKVICTPMACAPGVFKSDKTLSDRPIDICVTSNRYPGRPVRDAGETAVIMGAAEWCRQTNHILQVYGLEEGGHGWKNVPFIYDNYYVKRSTRLEAAKIYAESKVVLSVSSNDDSDTMCPNRIMQAASCGCLLLAYRSRATEWATLGAAFMSNTARHTFEILDNIFSDVVKFQDVANSLKKYMHMEHSFKNRVLNIIETVEDL